MSLHISNELKSVIRDYIYPIGAVYISVNGTNPKDLFGGTWQKVEGYYLLAWSNDTVGYVGGNWISQGSSISNTGDTVLNINQIPPHKHTLGFTGTSADVGNTHYHNFGEGLAFGISSSRMYNRSDMIDNTGGGQGHSHPMAHTHYVEPPYFKVAVWYRTG